MAGRGGFQAPPVSGAGIRFGNVCIAQGGGMEEAMQGNGNIGLAEHGQAPYIMDRPAVVFEGSGLGAMEQLREQLALRDDVLFVTDSMETPDGTTAVCACFKLPEGRATGSARVALFDYELPRADAHAPMGPGGVEVGDVAVPSAHDPRLFAGRVSERAEGICAATRLDAFGNAPEGFAESYPVKNDGSAKGAYYRGERLDRADGDAVDLVDRCRRLHGQDFGMKAEDVLGPGSGIVSRPTATAAKPNPVAKPHGARK